MVKKVNVLDQVANLLPEGLTEDSAKQIAKLFSDKLTEEINKVRESFILKIKAFVRSNIEQLKEQAVKELEIQDPKFRDYQLFNSIKSMMALELNGEDEVNGMNLLAADAEESNQKVNALANELDRVLKENIRLKNSSKILENKINSLEGKLNEARESIKENTSKAKLSDTSLVISKENFERAGRSVDVSVKPQKDGAGVPNEFLTEATLDLMPKYTNKEKK